ncbi:MAG: hypothetical protein P4L84_34070 [Isosphaeraceae bacterium]|nr:hypothetical protein [Isosphaeraceae bacterium]
MNGAPPDEADSLWPAEDGPADQPGQSPPPKPQFRLSVAYRFSNIHSLNKRQSELDFVDILVDTDIPLFVDPFAFKIGADDWSKECNDLVIGFFQELIDALRGGNQVKARELLANLHEPNETRLGVSRPKPSELPQGRGIGDKQAKSLYSAFAKSKAVRTGILTDLSDCELFIEGVSHDKISDITINIIRRKLVKFTQEQCRIWSIPMEMKPTGPCWDDDAKEWRGGFERLPVYRGSPILLVPKRAIRYRMAVDYSEYYDKHIIEHIRQEYERQECVNSAASLTKVLRGKRRVTKKSVKEKNPSSKAFVREFSEEHPDVLADYKREAEQNVAAGKFRPSDGGIYEKERDVAHSREMYLIEELTQIHNGDVIIVNAPVSGSVVGSGSQTSTAQTNSQPLLDTKFVIQFVAGDRGGGPRAQLQLPREEKKIKESVALGKRRDAFEFAPPVFAASIDEVIACQQHRPAIVHFAGHGEQRQMILVRDRDPLVDLMRLHEQEAEVLFKNFPDRLRLVVFNTCHSIDVASHLVTENIVDMAIAIEGSIPDDHAVRFAATLYRQLADGRSAQAAFDLAGLQVSDLDAVASPKLLYAAGVDPAVVIFAPVAH